MGCFCFIFAGFMQKRAYQKQLEKDFATEYCDCLSKQSDKTPEH
ncbi:hypothetical protein QW060_24940 [Myroides ceti]|uniref:Uncharacterized protein n=1 Tax=Paenimyroides ceti TaxID=395087 RepID=A0ABT8D0Z3_9FLAO|nr:hypothetical protein [Paenimyroides ceti]MDN3710129.1 hypothetical protein [Paenimyroides ceti]